MRSFSEIFFSGMFMLIVLSVAITIVVGFQEEHLKRITPLPTQDLETTLRKDKFQECTSRNAELMQRILTLENGK